ncbi:MAG: antibiotic biosynthesis monooxygenase [Sinimarinibacterium flocculans]|uniref:antibiotic biosynthesis monooxygenase n=1 Tax=Sinimarinibacterium flocculans TaxID=985250 RepID=UPI003C4BBD21
MQNATATETRASEDAGATAVIAHRIRADRQQEYESWLEEIAPLCQASRGHLDWHLVRPIPGLTELYTVVIRFDTRANLEAWMASPTRARLIEKARPLFVTGDDFFIRSGLDFWFAPAGARALVPVRWKQALLTWSAIYPLVLLVTLSAEFLLRSAGLATSRAVSTLLVTGVVVALMVYVVMPRYTRLLRRWLFE